MGQAKNRGSFEKRKAEAVVRNEQLERERQERIKEKELERERNMTPKQKAERTKIRAILASSLAISTPYIIK